tara:strand:+ start:599 stop:1063 length:465 start_codon:yes stop_codon:yes gene_type:complete
MTRWEKFEYLRDKGWTYNPETGRIFNSRGEVCSTNLNGYVKCNISIYKKGKIFKSYSLLGHHFAWFWVNGNIEINNIDHINRNKVDNRICNLRNVTRQVNQWNNNGKGYYYNKAAKKYKAQIVINCNVKYLGLYDTPEEARQAYLNAKQKYHVI